MSKTKKKTDKSLPIGIKLLLILLLSCSIVGTGVMAFILLIVAVFGFPILVYSITNIRYKLRIVAGHKYMAYHAVVKYVNSYKVRIDSDGRQYSYKYGTLVGMKENQVNDTPATLIFIPDDVLIFPDEVLNSQ